VAAFLVVPVVMSITAGLTVNFFQGVKSGLTVRWIGEVWRLYRETITLSLMIALACLAVDLVVGVPAAYVLAKARSRWTRLVEEALVLPIAVPGLATALALILAYGTWREFRTSWLFILVGHVLFTLPFMVRAVLAVLSSIDLRTLEEGAASLGAGFWQRFTGVVLPNCRGGILAGRTHGGDALRRRVQHDLDAAHASDQDAAGRPGRQLRVHAAGDRQRLHGRLLLHDHPAAHRHPARRAPPARAGSGRGQRPRGASRLRRDASERWGSGGHFGAPSMTGVAIRLEGCCQDLR
jgi:ABC-type tungstate transport system substrate-binding protein